MNETAKWDSIPPRQRTGFGPIYENQLRHLTQWRTLRWFLLGVLALLPGVVFMVHRGRPLEAFVVFVIGLLLENLLVWNLASGITCSNHGTFFRSREPVRYWVDVALIAAVFAGLCVGIWFIR